MHTVDCAKRRMQYAIGVGEVCQISCIKHKRAEASLAAYVEKAIEVCEKQLSDMHNQTTNLLSTHTLDDWMVLIQNAHSGQPPPREENAWRARFAYFLQGDSTRLSWPCGETGFLIRLMEWYQTRVQHLLYIETYDRVYHSEHANLTPVYENLSIPNSGLISTIKGSRLPLILPFHTVSPSVYQEGSYI